MTASLLMPATGTPGPPSRTDQGAHALEPAMLAFTPRETARRLMRNPAGRVPYSVHWSVADAARAGTAALLLQDSRDRRTAAAVVSQLDLCLLALQDAHERLVEECGLAAGPDPGFDLGPDPVAAVRDAVRQVARLMLDEQAPAPELVRARLEWMRAAVGWWRSSPPRRP